MRVSTLHMHSYLHGAPAPARPAAERAADAIHHATHGHRFDRSFVCTSASRIVPSFESEYRDQTQ